MEPISSSADLMSSNIDLNGQAPLPDTPPNFSALSGDAMFVPPPASVVIEEPVWPLDDPITRPGTHRLNIAPADTVSATDTNEPAEADGESHPYLCDASALLSIGGAAALSIPHPYALAGSVAAQIAGGIVVSEYCSESDAANIHKVTAVANLTSGAIGGGRAFLMNQYVLGAQMEIAGAIVGVMHRNQAESYSK